MLADALPSTPASATVVNTIVGPREASELEAAVRATGVFYLHAAVIGSTPAIARGALTILAGGKPSHEVAAVLGQLGETLVSSSTAEAAALKLVANGVLGDSVATLRRALRRGDALNVPRAAVVEVLEGGPLGRLIDGKHRVLIDDDRPPATFTAGALAKDLALLAAATDTLTDSGYAAQLLLDQHVVDSDDDITVLGTRATDASWLADARLAVSPEVVADPGVLRPLHAYARTHATGDPSFLDEAFLPTSHVEGYRDGGFSSWDLQTYKKLFSGSPADDEHDRIRRIERLDVRGPVATAVMTLHHGDAHFTDVFVLTRRPDGQWRIANKAYHRH